MKICLVSVLCLWLICSMSQAAEYRVTATVEILREQDGLTWDDLMAWMKELFEDYIGASTMTITITEEQTDQPRAIFEEDIGLEGIYEYTPDRNTSEDCIEADRVYSLNGETWICDEDAAVFLQQSLHKLMP